MVRPEFDLFMTSFANTAIAMAVAIRCLCGVQQQVLPMLLMMNGPK